ncbi:hypothetical protein ACO0LF_27125 [Undibacterium sp. Di27W]|uniref:hypothetical protein n=1 Tax=Undibacterium sp. Di27W TaxID=3413036 RepID=UPI003BF40B30
MRTAFNIPHFLQKFFTPVAFPFKGIYCVPGALLFGIFIFMGVNQVLVFWREFRADNITLFFPLNGQLEACHSYADDAIL